MAKDLKKVCADLKAVYTAADEGATRDALETSGKTRDGKYPMIYRSRDEHWSDLCEYFKYSPEKRRAIYTANAIEPCNYQSRKVTKNRATFSTDEAIFKIRYLAIRNASEKWTMPIKNRGLALNRFAIEARKRMGSILMILCQLHKKSDRLPSRRGRSLLADE
ncbi:MAG: transposase [Spirochaetaceae bacterium]|nr:transposase [Spirochaetaceae bacterium]